MQTLTKHTLVYLDGGARPTHRVTLAGVDHVVSDDITEELVVVDHGCRR